ncbi:MAG: DUF4097 family beta strand repeat-containing protein [Acidobacteriota bacterium]|nr:DUF4097 family beta strand repeat-containing protein [Acidobacteriota bacterium]
MNRFLVRGDKPSGGDKPLGLSYFLATALMLISIPSFAQSRDAAEGQQPIQARPGGPENSPKSDQTVDAVKGTRLVLGNNAGEVLVRSWDQDKVRIQATHGARDTVTAETTDLTLRVRTRSTRGPSGLVDYLITVPRWMAVNLSGTYLDATIEGTAAEVTVETVHGNVRVSGGSGAISIRSVQGVITIDKASGRVQATTVNEGIRVTNVTGEITAETTNGNIVIDNAQTSNLEASTVNGDVTFNGTVRDNGVYRLTTHGGDIRVGLGGAGNATVFVRTFQGDFTADFPVQLPEGQTPRSGSKRFNFTLGTGSARIELQSFNGNIVLARKAVVSKEEERQRRRGLSPVAIPPPAPPVPNAPPAPKAPKPPGWDDFAWDMHFDHKEFAKDFEENFLRGFGKDFEKNFEKQFEKNFGKEFEKNFERNFEKGFDNWFKSDLPRPKG